MAKREEPFSSIYSLAIGSELRLKPNSGESVEAAIKRLNKRTNKYQVNNRHFRLKTDGNEIVVQRIAKEHRGPRADFRMMEPGTALLVKTKPTTADRKRASETCDQLSSVRIHRLAGEREGGYWEPMTDNQGRLLIARYMGIDPEDQVPPRNGVKYRPGEVPVLEMWRGEWE